MELQEIEVFVNGQLPSPADKKKWVEASDRISFHAKGIRPQFYNSRTHPTNGRSTPVLITPANYEKRYQYLIDDYILNRHPNEQWEHYQWRLSAFPLVAEEAYLNAESQILGSIYQNSQYTVEAVEDSDVEYLDSIDFLNDIKYKVPRHIFTDPYGKIAVIEGHKDAFPATERAMPEIELVESRHILYFEKDTAIFFQSCEKIGDKKVFYWIDTKYIIRFVEAQRRDKDKEVLTYYEHGLGYMPVVNNDTYFFKPFVSRADMLCRNMSDDEVITKNASYPHITMYSDVCPTCQGGRFTWEPGDCEGGQCRVDCKSCGGKGTVSVNPGEIQFVPRSTSPGVNETGDIPQQKRFDNPDISINQHSLERVKYLEEKLLRSMHMLKTEEAQSGVAKSWDWQPMFYMLTRISEKLFDVNDFILYTILRILNPTQEPRYLVERPTQFQIKTESDIQAEYKELTQSNADLMIRREKQDEIMQTSLTGNALGLKRWEIIKYWDVLWGMSDTDISTAKVVGGIPVEYFTRHFFASNLIAQLESEKGTEWLLETPVEQISEQLSLKVKPFIPASAVEAPPIE